MYDNAYLFDCLEIEFQNQFCLIFQVWTCGSNNHHVLGHEPPPPALLTPRPINPRLLKPAGGPIIGAVAARYHTVLWSESVLLTFGLNGGQLGFTQLQNKTVTAPRQVCII